MASKIQQKHFYTDAISIMCPNECGAWLLNGGEMAVATEFAEGIWNCPTCHEDFEAPPFKRTAAQEKFADIHFGNSF